MWKQKNGFTLVEILVTLAIVAIVAAGATVAFLTQMQSKRVEADTEKLHTIENNVKLYSSYPNVFDELKNNLISTSETEPDKQDTVTFTFFAEKSGSKYSVDVGEGCINGDSSLKIKDVCPALYQSFTASSQDKIELESDCGEEGSYSVTFVFNAVKVSDVRGYSISNDAVSTTSSNTLFD